MKKIVVKLSEDKIAFCEKTAGLRRGTFSDSNSACLKVLVPVKIFQFQDMLNESERYRITPDYKNLIAKRQKAFSRGNRPVYCKLRNQVIREGKRRKSTFLNAKLRELKSNKNNKKWWDTVKELAGYPKSRYHLISSLREGLSVATN